MGERKKIASFEDLEVYQKLLGLHLEISEISLKFPKHELYIRTGVSKLFARCP